MNFRGFKEINRREGTKLLKWERAKRYFESNGWVEVDPTSRFRKFAKDGLFMFIGKSGAIRKGKSVTDSLDMAGAYWKIIEQWEQKTGKGDRA